MARHDRYTISALFKQGSWSPMFDVPRGESPATYAEQQLEASPDVVEISIYRNGRFVRNIKRSQHAVRS